MVELVTSATPVEDAAKRVVAALVAASARRESPRLGIAGGSALTAVGRVRELAPPGLWRALRLTWVDERVVPLASPDSSRGTAERSGALTPPPGLALPLVEDGEDADHACARFAPAFWRDFGGGLDVALLGLGEDGHVASLFPGHQLLEAAGVVAALTDSPKPPKVRVTLTLPVLATASTTRVVLATGAAKRDALTRLLARDPSLPATRLGALTVVTDQSF